MIRLIAMFTLILVTIDAEAARRALLIGINDYSASRLPRQRQAPAPGRDWPDLSGAVTDVGFLQQMLDFDSIVALKNQEATRDAILQSIERHLIAPATRGDVVLFYYAGHGSQVANSRSDEPDRLDESIVPADSRLGAPDIRDKELRVLFNRILNRGARLTVILDNCHSGSGARGTTRVRSVQRDPRDVADATDYGPRPEERGALVLTASQDLDTALETRDEENRIHGAFSWALIRAMRDAGDDETAEETFLRARARLRSEIPFQEPVIAGDPVARATPLFGTRMSRDDRNVVAVEKVYQDGTVILDGGWAHGLETGSELTSRDRSVRLTVTAIRNLVQSEARVQSGRVQSGALMEVVAPVRSFSANESRSPYRLTLRGRRDGRIVSKMVIGGESYEIVLRANEPGESAVRYYYVFVLDNRGKAILVFPRHGSVENRFPLEDSPPAEIPLGNAGSFEVIEPYGTDTYVLLSTEVPLANPWVLEGDHRGHILATPVNWSLEKSVYTSVPPRHKRRDSVSR